VWFSAKEWRKRSSIKKSLVTLDINLKEKLKKDKKEKEYKK